MIQRHQADRIGAAAQVAQLGGEPVGIEPFDLVDGGGDVVARQAFFQQVLAQGADEGIAACGQDEVQPHLDGIVPGLLRAEITQLARHLQHDLAGARAHAVAVIQHPVDRGR